jgi:hypothetical protein
MAKKAVRSREWTKEELRMLKTLGRAKTTAAVIAQKAQRSSDVSESSCTRRVGGHSSEETRSVKPILSAGGR